MRGHLARSGARLEEKRLERIARQREEERKATLERLKKDQDDQPARAAAEERQKKLNDVVAQARAEEEK